MTDRGGCPQRHDEERALTQDGKYLWHTFVLILQIFYPPFSFASGLTGDRNGLSEVGRIDSSSVSSTSLCS